MINDDSENELGKRFGRDDEDTKSDVGTDDTPDASDPDGTDESGDADESGDTGDSDATRKRKQYAMYLPESLHDDINDRYKRYDGYDKMSGGDGVEKHKDFNEAIIRAALGSDDLDDLVGVSPPDEE